MTDIIRLKQREAVLRLLFQNAHKDVEKPLHAQKNVVAKRDCLTISSEAMEIQKTAQIYGQSENIKFDQNVDIASYFEAAREANQKTLENAGDEITRSGQKCPYVSSGEVCYQILTDKYSKLIEEAKKQGQFFVSVIGGKQKSMMTQNFILRESIMILPVRGLHQI